MVYSSIRHFDRRGERKERTATDLIAKVRDVAEADWTSQLTPAALLSYVSQRVVQEVGHYSMLTDRLISNGELAPAPFNTFKFLASYPIPRQIWNNKPKPLGNTIARDVIGRRTSFGVGVAGHAAYEGGVIVAALLAYLAVLGVKLIDEPLKRQPTNPF